MEVQIEIEGEKGCGFLLVFACSRGLLLKGFSVVRPPPSWFFGHEKQALFGIPFLLLVVWIGRFYRTLSETYEKQ